MPSPRVPPTIEPLGEDALLLRFGDSIDIDTNARVHAAARCIEAARPQWLCDIVPAYASLALFVDVARIPSGADPLDVGTRWLRTLQQDDDALVARSRVVDIPVHYGGTDGADLDAVAAHAGLVLEEVIARHAAVEYRVAMLGFAPGFPYLLGLDPLLAMPRLDTPRLQVAAGSVGIGGLQTGIYPRSGPGGWRIIGRTDATLFDATRASPALLAPGDRVRLVPTGRST
jgi:KipI family sensor histidine kinase inhibitor